MKHFFYVLFISVICFQLHAMDHDEKKGTKWYGMTKTRRIEGEKILLRAKLKYEEEVKKNLLTENRKLYEEIVLLRPIVRFYERQIRSNKENQSSRKSFLTVLNLDMVLGQKTEGE